MRSPAILLTLLLPLTVAAQSTPTTAAKPTTPPATASSVDPIAASLSNLTPRCVGPTTMGGRIADIAVYEKEPRIYYVASAEGGIWKTENDGTTFTPLFTKESIASLGSVAVSQKDPNLVWLGTGEPSSRNSVGWGNGVYKSTDGGVTWQHMGLEPTKYISRIVIDPNDNNTVYVGALGDLWGFSQDRGLYKTTDGGKTWKKILYIDDKTGIGDLVIDPNNHNVLLCASWQRLRKPYDFVNGGPGGAMWRSSDGGNHWAKITKGLPPGPFGRIGLNFFRKNSNIMVATIEYRSPDPSVAAADLAAQQDEDGDLYTPGYDGDHDLIPQAAQNPPQKDAAKQIPPMQPAEKNPKDQAKEDTNAAKKAEAAKATKKIKVEPELPRGGTYISRDNGRTWTFTNGTNPRPFYFSIPRYDPQDINRIYVPGVSTLYTDDQGKTFRTLHETVHVDHHALWIDPRDSNHILVGEDGGVGETYDRGKSWKMVNNLPVGQFYIATYDMRKPYWVYGGLQDNGCWATPTQTRHNGVDFQDSYNLSGGDGFYCQVDPTNWRVAYSESQGGSVVRTDQQTGEQKFIAPRAPKGETYRFNWNTPILLSPFNPSTVYVGGNKLFKSTDRGDHWEPISPDLTTNNSDELKPGKSSPTPDINSGAEQHCTIVSVSESPLKAGLIWCGTDDGNVQLTQDGGKTWTNVSANIPNLPKELWVSRVLASKFSEGRAYVTIDGHRSDDFHPYAYMTDDYGKTWTSIANGLPQDASLYVVQEGAKNENLVLLGSETSIQISLDRGKSWTKYDNKDFPTVPVYDLEIQPRDLDLIVATHGRSIWTINIAGLEQFSGDVQKADAAVFQPKDVLLLGRTDDSIFSGDQTWISNNTQPGTEIPFYLKNDLSDDATIQVADILGNAGEPVKVGKTAGFHVYPWRAEIKGRRVKPGDYRVTLKANGKEYVTSVHVEDVSETLDN